MVTLLFVYFLMLVFQYNYFVFSFHKPTNVVGATLFCWFMFQPLLHRHEFEWIHESCGVMHQQFIIIVGLTSRSLKFLRDPSSFKPYSLTLTTLSFKTPARNDSNAVGPLLSLSLFLSGFCTVELNYAIIFRSFKYFKDDTGSPKIP